MGGFFHEAVGIGIGALFIIHILLNRSMTKGLMASVRAGSGGIRKRLLLASDLILFIGMPLVILTGILIAKELFVLRIGLPWKQIFLLHKYASYGCLAAICLHVLMHARYLAGVVKSCRPWKRRSCARRSVALARARQFRRHSIWRLYCSLRVAIRLRLSFQLSLRVVPDLRKTSVRKKL